VGNVSQETVVFALALAWQTWLLSDNVGWSIFRQKRPLLGLTLMGTAVGLNSYFGQNGLEWAAAFVGLSALATAVMHYAHLEQDWLKNQVDFSTEIRLELGAYAGGIAIGLLILALILPSFSISRLAQLFRQQEAVQAAESSLERAFAGIRQPLQFDAIAGTGGSGTMPRSYLLGNAPELYETVVMTAVVTPIPPPHLTHWRALSYEIYTGRGWALSEERVEDFAANTDIPLPPVQGQTTFQQDVHWLFGERVIRYTIGQPRQFDQDVVTSWRGLDDLVRVQSEGSLAYRAITQASTATAAELRQASGTIPPVLLTRYTQLPRDFSWRVRQLAEEVAGEGPTAYDQAIALEQFLRQYTYSLDITAPPPNTDPVEYFLFEQQAGYCDYYATAMTVMARSLGLPARMVIGYLAQEPDENGVQTIRQINGHSWTEIYFPAYGWVSFEPTAAFPAAPREAASSADFFIREDFIPEPSLPLSELPPVPAADVPIPWGRLATIGGIGLMLLGVALWRRYEAGTVRGVGWAYGRLQHHARKLGQPTPVSQTPTEFVESFTARLGDYGRSPRLARWVTAVRQPIEQLTAQFVGRQYSQKHAASDEVAYRWWREIRRPLWLLRLWQFFKKPLS
jgi:transglutaminase-like putative cysteine protease